MRPAPFLTALALAFTTGFAWAGFTDADIPTLVIGDAQLRLMEPAPKPDISAVSAIAVDVSTGTVLYEKDPERPMAPASTVKLMTALVVMETSALDTVVTIRPEDLVGGSTMGLRPGQKVRISDLLYGLLLPSGNDAAMALARTVGDTLSHGEADPVGVFVEVMNREARRLGMASTHFTTPHGLDDPDQHTTARDLAILAAYVMRFPFLRSVMATREYVWNGDPPKVLKNTNELLGTYPGADGMKTGTTELAGECLVATVTRGGRTTLLVLLGSTDRYTDARSVLDRILTYYTSVDVGEVLSNVNYPPVVVPYQRIPETIVIPKWERAFLKVFNYPWEDNLVWSDLWLADSLLFSMSLRAQP